ncbi:ABC-F family ATP-binding cassette domain-containing protein [candidate division KSB1 bacterium]|nr:ABC-F family ATP-binding cassette domain-containing protein [candidate division KSB1 bacterium]
MPQAYLKFHGVGFTYESAVEPLFSDLSLHFAPGWSGVVGANGTGKTTLLKLAAGLLQPDAGRIEAPVQRIYCPQRTDEPPANLADLLHGTDKSAVVIRGRLGVQNDWLERWPTLSHGERKRAQIAVALWLEPEILAIDEPTNHVDAEAREVLLHALQSFSGIGLLVSHDRELLDTLCRNCLFIDPPEVVVRPGNYSTGAEIASADERTVHKQREQKKQALQKLQREVGRRRDLANRSGQKRSKKGLARHDRDGRQKIDAARVTGKDAVGGKLLRQLDGRLEQAEHELDDVRVKKRYAMGIWLPGSVSTRNALFQHEPGSLALGPAGKVILPHLTIRPTDRIALTGANGSGKSTLLRWLLPQLNVPAANLTYLPQEIDAEQSRQILAEARALPNEQLGHVMTLISRLGSRPHRLLESAEPSPGEVRKLLLALGMTRLPHIIIMDEPTNHLDLPSIECLESALAECPCALLLVSHDRRFLRALTTEEWHLSRNEDAEEGEKGGKVTKVRRSE